MILFKRKNIVGLLILVFFVLCGFRSFSQKEDPIKILIVGNSFTFYWNMPQMVEAMAESQGLALSIKQSTVSGSNLKQHWLEEKNTKTRQLLDEEEWDYVIFHDHSLSTIKTPERFEKYSRKFDSLIRSKSAKPILFETWAYNSNPLMQESVSMAYHKMATELGSGFLPVGSIWMKARKLRPDLDLYSDDKHPSPEGSYLIALIVFKTLTGHSLEPISNRLTTFDKNGNLLYLSFISERTASFFKQLVEEYNIKVINLEKQ